MFVTANLDMEGCIVAHSGIISGHAEHVWGGGVCGNLNSNLKMTDVTIRDCYAECFVGPVVRVPFKAVGIARLSKLLGLWGRGGCRARELIHVLTRVYTRAHLHSNNSHTCQV